MRAARTHLHKSPSWVVPVSIHRPCNTIFLSTFPKSQDLEVATCLPTICHKIIWIAALLLATCQEMLEMTTFFSPYAILLIAAILLTTCHKHSTNCSNVSAHHDSPPRIQEILIWLWTTEGCCFIPWSGCRGVQAFWLSGKKKEHKD